MKKIVTRFAPSPTGFLHIGGVRTALYAYLLAKKHDGDFMLRIEDTDRGRLVEGAVENIVSSLQWSGMEANTGVWVDGEHNIIQRGDLGPYIQSERLEVYHSHLKTLLEKDGAYYCFCSKERLDEVRKVQQLNKQPLGYDGHCRTLGGAEVKKKIEAGETHVVRLKVPKEGSTTFSDIIRGEVAVENKNIDDQVLIKSDGFPTYHFAVVVDDHTMEATHVIRGEEWISSTPKHIILYDMFGWDAPEHAHLPVIVNEKKQKLSKRHGDVSVEDFKEKGYLPEALTNFLAFLGWNPGDDREIFSIDELVEVFDIAKVQKAPAFFNREKLDWYNKQYMANIDAEELARRTAPFFRNAGVLDKEEIDEPEELAYLASVVSLEQGRAHTLLELVESLGFIFADELVYDTELLAWRKSTLDDANEKLTALVGHFERFGEGEWVKDVIEEKTLAWIKEQGWGNGDVLWPTRVALSGKKNSPGPFEIAAVLGKEKALERIQHALGKLK